MRYRLLPLAVALIPLLAGCQSGVWKAAGDTAAKGSFIAGPAAVGAVIGGPLGGAVGALLGWFGVDKAEIETAYAQAQAEWDAERAGHAEEVRAAQASGQQQGSDQAQSIVAQLAGDQEAAAFFRDRAAEATIPLKAQLEAQAAAHAAEMAKAEARAFWQKWGTIIAFLVIIGLYWLKQRIWGKKRGSEHEQTKAELRSELADLRAEMAKLK